MPHTISSHAQKFLHDCATQNKTLNAVLDDNDVSTEQLCEWLNDDAFKASLGKLRRRLRFCLELDVARGGAFAAERLASCAYGSKTLKGLHVERKALGDLIRLARIGLKPTKASRGQKELPGPGYHPSVSPIEAEKLLADLAQESTEESTHAAKENT